MNFLSLLPLLLLVTSLPVFAAPEVIRPGTLTEQASPERRPSPSLGSLPPPAATGPLRILLVDDDLSDNNHTPGDTRLSRSDTIFRQLVADAVGGDANAWAIEAVKPYSNGPDVDRLRRFPLILWYTGASYGGNPDNSAVLSIEDEKTVRRYLEEIGGVVVLVSPGYVSKVLAAGSTWEESTWPFLSGVLGIRGGQGLAQRFLPGTVNASDGAQFKVGKGDAAVESQFSTVNPDGAAVLFTTSLTAAKKTGRPAPVATAFPYGRGRIIYVGFTFENLDKQDLAPAFRHILTATGLLSKTSPAASRPLPTKTIGGAQDAGPATVQVSGTPTSAVVSWTLPTATILNASPAGAAPTARRTQPTQAPMPAQAPSVTVERLVANAAPVRLNVASPDAMQANDPGPLTPGQAVTYRVTLTDARGVSGAREASFTPPLPRDPAGLTATSQNDATVVLSWQAVPEAAGYQISGTALATAVIVRGATSWRSAPQGAGPRQWRVATVYEPGGVLTAPANWPSVQSRYVPVAGAAFLSLPSGAGGLSEADAHYRRQCGLIALQNCSAENLLLSSTTWQKGTWGEFVMKPAPGGPGKPFVHSDVRTYLTPHFPSVAFADLNDLGRGRRVGCADGSRYADERTTVCWAASHGPILAPGATANGVALAQAAEQFVDRNISLSTIVITSRGAMFGAWMPPPPPWPVNSVSLGPSIGHRVPQTGNPDWWSLSANDAQPAWLGSRNWDLANLAPWQREAIIAAVARPALTTGFDSQGPKSVPHACVSCHGGRYDPTSGLVQGASLLPLIPAELGFSSPLVRARVPGAFAWPDFYQNSEEAIRMINEIIYRSNPSPTIKQRIETLYSGMTLSGSPIGTRANDNAVPPGWSTQPGLYRQVIAPYCGSCHFAQTGPLNFGTFANVLSNKQRIQKAVCVDFSMPHSEIAFRKFWTEGGAVSLPGMLSTVLGFPKCPE